MKTPPLNRTTVILLFGIALVAALYFARHFLIPLTFGIILSMLVLPICKKLEGWGWHRGWAILVCLLIIIGGFAGLLTALAAPVASFNQDLPQLQSSFEEKMHQVQEFIAQKFNIPIEKQNQVKSQGSSPLQTGGKALAGFLSGLLSFSVDAILVLVYVLFFLQSREKFENFVIQLNDENNHREVRKVIGEVSQVSQQYLAGRFLSILSLAILYTIGLTIIGLKHAVLFGGLAALLTIVPFVGTVVGGIFPMAAAIFSNSGTSPVAALGVVLFIQLIDEYFLEPFIVGGKVNLSPLASIVAVVVGELIWGVAGMILFIPMLAMAKIVFDHVPYLQPYGELLGKSEGPENKYVAKVKNWFKAKFKKAR
jgi:predicted PurR-regulated permease PerM